MHHRRLKYLTMVQYRIQQQGLYVCWLDGSICTIQQECTVHLRQNTFFFKHIEEIRQV